MSLKYWEDSHFEELDSALTYAELFLVAEKILNKMPKPIVQVCGPISTGGAGSIEKNIERFKKTISDLQNLGMEVFDQVPFESPMQKIKKLREATIGSDSYDNSILEDFYLPIFESNLVKTLYFLPDWESSIGAKWEHEQAKRLGLEIIYIES